MSATIEENNNVNLSTRIAPQIIVPHPKEKEIISFEETWTAPMNLRPKHKKELKRYFSLKSGRDGSRSLCYSCNMEFGNEQIEIHHIDHDRRNNQLSNVLPACRPCNDDERRIWLSEINRSSHAAHHIGTQLKKEKTTNKEVEQANKLLQQELLKQAPTTFQKSVSYKQQTLAYLVRYVKEAKQFDQAVADIEALTGCSHAKAIEYLNAFSISVFAGWRQWFNGESGQWIAPRNGPAYDRAVKEVAELE